MSDSEDDGTLTLSSEAITALNEFYIDQEKQRHNIENKDEVFDMQFSEDWQLSQFWYNEKTINLLSEEISRICKENGKIALISCPSLFKTVKSKAVHCEVKLFEFDRRFSVFGEDFIFYDFNCPFTVPQELCGSFDVVVVDPPFLSDDCLTKTAITIKLLTNSKIILCTGAVMEDLAKKLLKLRKSNFQPEHQNNLANEFCCYTNYDDCFIKC